MPRGKAGTSAAGNENNVVFQNLMWRSFNCDFVAFLWFEFVENRQ